VFYNDIVSLAEIEAIIVPDHQITLTKQNLLQVVKKENAEGATPYGLQTMRLPDEEYYLDIKLENGGRTIIGPELLHDRYRYNALSIKKMMLKACTFSDQLHSCTNDASLYGAIRREVELKVFYPEKLKNAILSNVKIASISSIIRGEICEINALSAASIAQEKDYNEKKDFSGYLSYTLREYFNMRESLQSWPGDYGVMSEFCSYIVNLYKELNIYFDANQNNSWLLFDMYCQAPEMINCFKRFDKEKYQKILEAIKKHEKGITVPKVKEAAFKLKSEPSTDTSKVANTELKFLKDQFAIATKHFESQRAFAKEKKIRQPISDYISYLERISEISLELKNLKTKSIFHKNIIGKAGDLCKTIKRSCSKDSITIQKMRVYLKNINV